VSLLGRPDLRGLTQLVHPAGVERLSLQSTGSKINSVLLTQPIKITIRNLVDPDCYCFVMLQRIFYSIILLSIFWSSLRRYLEAKSFPPSPNASPNANANPPNRRINAALTMECATPS
jgi:hypothetical protein